jgi:hypothetical protein
LPSASRDGNFAQDDSLSEADEVDFQINDETYFASLGEGEWQVFVATPTGARSIPVYDDGPDLGEVPVLFEDQHRRKIIN